jgi:hypothetical protein
VSQSTNEVSFDVVSDAGTFEFVGRVAGSTLKGTWNLFGVGAEVVAIRGTARTVPYVRESVSCRNGDVTLAGTLLVPSGPGPHPAVVFAHGSGPETRDASSFLADQLARRQIVALTFDKRGTGASTGNWREADFNDLAGDVLGCIDLLKTRNNIDKSRIGIAGASQAGWVAPLAASRSKDIAFIALVSGPAVPVWKEGWWDTEFRMRERGFGDRDIEKARAILQLNDDVTRTGDGFTELSRLIEASRAEPWFPALGFQQAPAPDAPFRTFYRRILDFDPLPLLQGLSIPSLWLFGGRDGEMPSQESAIVLDRLRAQGQPITVRTFPDADHSLFVTNSTPSFRWPRVAPGYIETFVDWVSNVAFNAR